MPPIPMVSPAALLLSLIDQFNLVSSTPVPSIAPIAASAPATSTSRPTRSPIEFTDITILNDGGIHRIYNEETSYLDENIIVTKNTTLIIETGGYIEAPINTSWPAIRLTIGSNLTGLGGYVNGSYAEGCDEIGCGDAIHVSNGQSGPETASYAEFHDGIYVIGGDAPDGIGGNALQVNGFGTDAVIYGGNFIGGKGKGVDYNGYSVQVINSGMTHIHAGNFDGEMAASGGGVIQFYGCFMKNGTRVTGLFVDDSELDIVVRTTGGGSVMLTSVSEQECETAPSISPTNYPTMSPQPTITRPNHGEQMQLSFEASLLCVLLLLKSLV